MRVIYLSPYPPARDGIGNYTCALANAVSEAGNDIAVIVPHGVLNAPAEVIGSAFRARSAASDIRATVERWKPDIIHVQFAVAAFGGRSLLFLRWLKQFSRASGIPVVVTLHEVTRETALLPILGSILFRRIARHCQHLIVHTDAALTTLTLRVGISQTMVTVIPHPTAEPPALESDPADLRARFALGDARVLLAFGFIHVDKGLDDLVRALSIIRRTDPALLDGVRLVVAGAIRTRRGLFRVFEARDHLHLAHVLHLARRSGLQHTVVRTGYVPAGDVSAWFQLSDAAVLPYRRTEQSGVASLARSFDITILASRVGGLAELFSDSRWTFPPMAPALLADTITTFLTEKRGEHCAPYLSSSPRADDLSSVTDSTLAVYRKVICGKAGRERFA